MIFPSNFLNNTIIIWKIYRISIARKYFVLLVLSLSFAELLRGYTGEPEPEVVWLKDGKRIKPKKRDTRLKIDWDISTDMYFLEIQTATQDDKGTYEVVVTNDKGEMRSTFVLSFHEARKVKVIGEQLKVEDATTTRTAVSEEVIVTEQETHVQKIVKTTTQVKR